MVLFNDITLNRRPRMASVSRALLRIKHDLDAHLPNDAIEAACRDAGHLWRTRLLGPVLTIHLFVLQLLNGNTAMLALRHLAGFALNPSAYCKARMRLPVAVLQHLLQQVAMAINRRHQAAGEALWRGHCTLLLDGSSAMAPETPANLRDFPRPSNQKPGCGFAVPKILAAFDAVTGVLLQLLDFPLYTHEAAKVWMLAPGLRQGDLVVADRGFCSYVNLVMLWSSGVLALLRTHQKQIVDFRPHRKHNPGGKKARKGRPTSRWIRRLGKHDQLVEWIKPKLRPQWMSPEQYAALSGTLQVREIRYTLQANGQRTRVVTIVTTLLDPTLYPKQAIVELYGLRWNVETNFGHLKTTLKMRRIKCKTADGVRKELLVYALVYNLVRAVMLESVRRQQVREGQISFIDALRWLQSADANAPVPDLVVNPRRPDRHQPRVVKDFDKGYRKMTRPRNELRKLARKGVFLTK
jgi:hypothetical protein